MSEQRDLCSNCGTELEDEVPGQARQPCPNCGSTARTTSLGAHVAGQARVTASLTVIRAWDSASLTLAGVLYGILVTVAGVIIAPHGTLPAVVYGVVALSILAVGLLWFAQPIIGAMRWLLERGKR